MTGWTNRGRVNSDARGYQELFERDGEYVVVSTVEDMAAGLGFDEVGIVHMAGRFMGYPTSGAETMAFKADANGEITDWCELLSATGPDSRSAVLAELDAT